MLNRLLFRVVLFAIVAIVAACEKVPLLAPSQSSISVTAQSRTLAPGARTEITATVVESGGTPVHNGTLVRFTASLGRVEPAEVETRGGTATTTFIAGDASGTAQIRASSGAASGGEAATPTNLVEIQIGGAAAAAVSVSASPSRVGPSGGTVTVLASATDTAGNRLVGVPITFSSDAGTLSANSAVTDSSGEARVTLSTDRQAVVTARVGDKSGTVTITVATAATVTLTVPTTAVPFGTPVAVTIAPAANTSPRVLLNWGDGSSEDLGIVAAQRSATHIYQSAASYTITATATADGQSFTTAAPVTVAPRPPLNVNVTVSPTSTPNQCAPVTFTAAVTEGTTVASASSYQWTIDSNSDSEDETITTTGNQLTRAWQNDGRKTVSVTATTSDGRTGNGQTQVVVQRVTTTPAPSCS